MRVRCPWCGDRGWDEFVFGGEETRPRPALADAPDDAAWADYLHFRDNIAGPRQEWWGHVDGCGGWFRATRDTRSSADGR